MYKIGTFTSEKQLSSCVRSFFADPIAEIFVLQCDTLVDAPHILLAKSLIDQLRIEHIDQSSRSAANTIPRKHLLIVLHLSHTASLSSDRWQFNYQSGWNQIAIDTLENTPISQDSLLHDPLVDLLRHDAFSLAKRVREIVSNIPSTNPHLLRRIFNLNSGLGNERLKFNHKNIKLLPLLLSWPSFWADRWGNRAQYF